MQKKIKAIGLFSGGLDSLLAIKILQAQGIEVHAFTCVSAFFGNAEKLQSIADQNGFPLYIDDVSKEYIRIVKEPRYGYGKNMNPCVDCKIFIIQQAQKYAQKIGAQFLFTGEVLGQRPMSQQKQSLGIIQKRSGIEGFLLRPLSAKLMEETEVEKNGWVDREKLFDINGRSRARQFELAKEYDLKDYGSPAGGCLLAEKQYAQKLRDIFALKKRIFLDDIRLLKIGRYFRDKKTIIIVGRNKEENEKLQTEKKASDWLFKLKDIPGPTTLVRGPKNTKTIYTAAALTARYGKLDRGKVTVTYGKNEEQTMEIDVPTIEACDALKKNIEIC